MMLDNGTDLNAQDSDPTTGGPLHHTAFMVTRKQCGCFRVAEQFNTTTTNIEVHSMRLQDVDTSKFPSSYLITALISTITVSHAISCCRVVWSSADGAVSAKERDGFECAIQR